jgi:hypothetical protein
MSVPGIGKDQITSTAAWQIQKRLEFVTSVLSDALVYGEEAKQKL